MSSSEVLAWAGSGAMALTGRPGGPPLVAPGRPAGLVRDHLRALGLDIPTLLGERAAYAGLVRRAPWSCGGAMRIMPASDGHVALSLARASDLELVPALVEGAPTDDPWGTVAAWLATTTAAEAEARLRILGMPGGEVDTSAAPPQPVPPPAWVSLEEGALVVDLSALWAGPLCTHLLGLLGARVVKVESVARPDGARRGSMGFFELLNGGKEHLSLDLPREISRLRQLVADADLVVESSRPRALRQLGLAAEEVVAQGTTWLSITARGRSSDSVGFGDDVAACAGLVLRDGEDLVPVGDAIADPLTGVVAAVRAVAALQADCATLLDVAMLDVVRDARAGSVEPHDVTRRKDGWYVETGHGDAPVLEPRRRP
jgi:crotonobetainyl-CoA:carnitine CoA-transferase CaiB-like acyl-CoA transferase